MEAANAYFLVRGVPEAELPDNDRGRKYLVGRHMDREMRRAYIDMRQTFHIDGYYEGIVEFEDMPRHLDELEEFIEAIESSESDSQLGDGPGLDRHRTAYPTNRKFSTCEVYSSGFSKGTQWPQLLRSTNRESAMLLRAVMPISKTHMRS